MKVLTQVKMSRLFEKQLERVPHFIRDKVLVWIEAVELKSMAEVRKTPGYHDEPLSGIRTGQRSVRMNRSYRIIYEVIEDNVYIRLLEINKHGY